jgi:nicotinate dehydrogenase subunit B
MSANPAKPNHMDATGQAGLEPERYELHEPPAYCFDLERRKFFKFLGAGLLVVCVLREAWAFEETGGRRQGGSEPSRDIGTWLHIGENGVVTGYTGKVEIGQNIRTSLAQAIAEELHFPFEKIQMVMGDTQLTPFDAGTFGSRTTPMMNFQLRKVAAAARGVLLGLAATQWNVPRARLVASGGKITDTESKRTAEYAELLKGQQLTQMIPGEDPLETPSEWTVAGQVLPKVDGRDFVTGRHQYPSDKKLPGMWYGKVLRPPSFGATLVSVSPPGPDLMKDVIFIHDGNFVGVAAPSVGLASAALAGIRAEWKSEPQISNKELFDYLKTNSVEKENFEGSESFQKGSLERGLASADHQMRQTYTTSYIAHAPLEPRAALAEWSGDSLTVWTGTQRPFGVRSELAEAFHLSEDRIRVLMPDMGSGYGGKHTGECAIEAARLARAVNQAVKLTWTREEEFTWAYFRPAGVIEVSSGVRNDGTITAWEFHNYNSGGSGIRTFYDIPNQRMAFHSSRSPLRQGSYRALAATANHFARESHMDELAHEVNIDPLEFRLKNLKDERLRAVLEAAAKAIGWGHAKAAPGQGFGIGCGAEKGGYVATCAEVSATRSTGEVRVVHVVTAFECGAIVNPDGLRNQVAGANIMGLGGALFEGIEFENGRILNGRFSKYRVPRFSDIPRIETVLLDRRDIPSAGAGETPIVGLAPAVGNAIFDATGMRLRSLPLVPNGLKTAWLSHNITDQQQA